MSLASRDTESHFVVGVEVRAGAGGAYDRKGAQLASSGSNVIHVNFSAGPAPKALGRSLSSFLDEMEADPTIAELLPVARRDVADVLQKWDGGPTLATLRLHLGLSQAELADKLGTTQTAVSEWERRKRKPGEDAIRRLCVVLGVDANTLMDALANADA